MLIVRCGDESLLSAAERILPGWNAGELELAVVGSNSRPEVPRIPHVPENDSGSRERMPIDLTDNRSSDSITVGGIRRLRRASALRRGRERVQAQRNRQQEETNRCSPHATHTQYAQDPSLHLKNGSAQDDARAI